MNNRPKSFCIITSDGTINRTKNIPKPKPKDSVIIVGFKNCAAADFSNNKGANPKTVVKVVSKTGLNLSQQASTIAGIKPRFSEYSSIVVTSTIESLIIIPLIPIIPTILNIDNGISITQ